MMRASLLLLACAALAALPVTDCHSILHEERSSAGDLEVGGEIAGVPAKATRFIGYEDLLGLPQESYAVTEGATLDALRAYFKKFALAEGKR